MEISRDTFVFQLGSANNIADFAYQARLYVFRIANTQTHTHTTKNMLCWTIYTTPDVC